MPHDEPLQERGVHHSDLLRLGLPEKNAPDAVAADADARGEAVAGDEREDLQLGAAGEHVLEVPFLHAGVADAELPEAGEDVGAAMEAGSFPVFVSKSNTKKIGATSKVRLQPSTAKLLKINLNLSNNIVLESRCNQHQIKISLFSLLSFPYLSFSYLISA